MLRMYPVRKTLLFTNKTKMFTSHPEDSFCQRSILRCLHETILTRKKQDKFHCCKETWKNKSCHLFVYKYNGFQTRA